MWVTVVNAAGRHLDLELPAGSSIRDVKVRLSSFWDLPIRAQKLLLGEEELENSATLDNYLFREVSFVSAIPGDAKVYFTH